MIQAAGVERLAVFMARRDRVRLTIWVVGLAAMTLVTAVSVKGLYPDAASLRQAADAANGSTAAIALQAPAHGIDTLGGRTVFELGAFGFITVALMNILLVVRHTRGEEEQGRAELIRSAAVGRDAALAASLVVALGADLAFAALNALLLIAVGLPVVGSVTFSLALAAVGLVFAAVAAVAAQVTEHARAAGAVAAAVLVLAYVLRAVGDVGSGALSWASPIGWGQYTRAYAGDVWWTLALPVGVTVMLFAGAIALAGRRDVGAGMWSVRPGRQRAARSLLRPLGLAVRLDRATVAGWTVGLFVGGVTYGSVGKDIGKYVGDNPQLRRFFEQGGAGKLVDLYFATTLGMLALVAAGFTLQAMLRIRNEETSNRGELTLATEVTRRQWLASHVVVALVGSALVAVATGLGAGLAYGLSIHDLGQVPRLTAAAAAQIPALWVLAAVAALLIGWLPRAVNAVWGVLAVLIVIGVFGDMLRLPQLLRDVSPFAPTSHVPSAAMPYGAAIVLCVVAVVGLAAGAVGLARRDIG